MCPVTNQPDMYVATIEYEPDELCLESKSLKLYLAALPQRRRVLRGARGADPGRRRRGARAAARAGQRHARAEGARRDHDRRLDLTAVRPHRRRLSRRPVPAAGGAARGDSRSSTSESLDRWFVTRHAEVRACLRDRRLGRNFRHVGSEEEFAAPSRSTRAGRRSGTPSAGACSGSSRPSTRASASSSRPRSRRARSRRCAARRAELAARAAGPSGRFDLLRDFAQPYSIARHLPAARRPHRPRTATCSTGRTRW